MKVIKEHTFSVKFCLKPNFRVVPLHIYLYSIYKNINKLQEMYILQE